MATVVTGAEWHEGRLAMEVLRECGYSWTQISKAVGLDRGWARSAYDSKHVMEEKHLRNLLAETRKLPRERVEEALAHIRGERVADRVATGLITEKVTADVVGELAGAAQRLARAREIADAIRRVKGHTWDTVAQVFGYASGNSAQSTISSAGDIGRDKLERAETWWSTQGPGKPATNGKHEPEARPEPGPERKAAESPAPAPRPPQPPPPRPAKPDTWDSIRADAVALADRIKLMVDTLPLDGVPASLREDVKAAFGRRHDRLLKWIEEELE